MLKLIRKDLLLIFFATKVNILAMVLLIPFLLLFRGAEGINEVTILSMSVLGYFLTIFPFNDELRTKPHLLIQSLSLNRVEVVISKYILSFINFIIGLVYTVTYLWIIKYFKILNVDIFSIQLIKEAFLIVILALSIALPGFLILKPNVATMLSIFIYFAVINSLVTAPKRVFGRLETLNRLSIAIVILYFISMGISIWLYERKDLI